MKYIYILVILASLSFTGNAQINQTDSLALVAFYYNTAGPKWTDNTNWLKGPVTIWIGIDEAGGRVTGITLINNQVSGSIPEEIWNLSNLKVLVLPDNKLRGSIPTEIGNLSNLQRLDLSGNQLSGSIPAEIGNLSNLTGLHLENNQLSGSIPAEIGNLSNLTVLHLKKNQLSGSIPVEIGDLSNLQVLDLTSNQLDEMPDLSGLPNLGNCNVANNRLTFEDLEPNIGIAGFDYAPQAKLGSIQHLTPNTGDRVDLVVTTGGSANIYQWSKDSWYISGATDSIYTISSYDAARDSGTYYCYIHNTIVTGMSLFTNNYCVGVEVPNYSIAVSASPAEGGNVTGGGIYNDGDSATVTATTNTGYSFVNWTETNSEVSTDSNYSFTVSNNRTLVANLAIQTCIVSVSASPGVGGTVSGDGTYDYGEEIVLSATENTGYGFVNWTENGNEVSTNTSYTFTVSGNCTLVANFMQTIGISAGNKINNIKIIPNPSRGQFTITSDANIKHIKIYGLAGKIVYEKKYQSHIDISYLNNGIYFLKFFDRNNVIFKVEKIIIEK